MKRKSTKSHHPSNKAVSRKKSSEDAPRRSIWRGFITFGLVNIPVILYSAEKPGEQIRFKLLDKHNLSNIRYVRINVETGEEVPWQDIVKGYEYESGNYAVLTDKDFQEVTSKNVKTIEIEDFVNLSELDPLYFEKPYYLLPDKHSDKGYVLLREILKETKKVGIARFMVHTHQYLGAIIAYESAIFINTLRYSEEVKTEAEIDAPHESINKYKISKKEFEIAKQLVNTMTVKWDPEKYHNEYHDNLMKLIEEKKSLGNNATPKHSKDKVVKQTNVIDFMALLQKSVKEKKKSPATKSKKKQKSDPGPKKKPEKNK